MEALAEYTGRGVHPEPRWVVAERTPAPPAGAPRLLDRVRGVIRTRHLSPRAEEAYVLWILYRRILNIDLPWLDGLVRAKRPVRLPVVLSRDEVAAVLAQLDGTRWLMAALLYGTGLRLLETSSFGSSSRVSMRAASAK